MCKVRGSLNGALSGRALACDTKRDSIDHEIDSLTIFREEERERERRGTVLFIGRDDDRVREHESWMCTCSGP
jgi:hypothetical protein